MTAGRAPQARGSRRRRRRGGGGWGVERVSPPSRVVPLPRKKIDFGSQYGEFWCILDGIFYGSTICFTRKTGVIWCPSRYFFLNFHFKKDLVHFLTFWRRQKLHAAGPVLVRPSECITLHLGLIARRLHHFSIVSK